MSAEDDRKATETVLQVLRSPSIWKVKFMTYTTIKTKSVSRNTRTFTPLMYEEVAKAIVDKKITIMVLPNILPPGAGAAYLHKLTLDADTEFYDIIALPKPDLGNTVPRQIEAARDIVHECTHAGIDMLKLPKMTHLEHEVASYVAGSLFAAEAMLLLRGNPRRVNGLQGPAKAAWDIALLEFEDKPVPRALYDALALAIRTSPLYKDFADKELVNDGVGKEWKIKRRAQ